MTINVLGNQTTHTTKAINLSHQFRTSLKHITSITFTGSNYKKSYPLLRDTGMQELCSASMKRNDPSLLPRGTKQ